MPNTQSMPAIRTFAPRFHELLQRACGIAGRRPNLADSTLRNYARKLDADLDALLRIKPSHAEGKKFQATIKACRQHLFVFMKNRAIPPTNNGSESRRSGLVSHFVRLQTASDPNGAPNSTPTSDPSSKPQGAEPSGLSRPSD